MVGNFFKTASCLPFNVNRNRTEELFVSKKKNWFQELTMNIASTLDVLAGGLLFLPKGWVAMTLLLWVITKASPLTAVLVFTGSLIWGGLR
jgi:hypothetical protein